jgi:hypothetical protein
MLKNVLCVSILAALAAIVFAGQASAQGAVPNLAGTYRCTPEPIACNAPSYTVTQNGNVLELKAENGPIAEAKVTSNRTLSGGPPFNSNGLILPDNSIQWSNGTHWRK